VVRWGRGAGAVVLCVLVPGLLAGQAPGDVRITADARFRLEDWRWFGGFDASDYSFLGGTLRAGLTQQRSGFGWQAELAAPILRRLPDDAVRPAPQGQLGLGAAYYAANAGETNPTGLFLKQAYLRIGSMPGQPGHLLRAGRFEFAEGAEVAAPDPTIAAIKRDRIAHRLLGTFGWSHVGRSFDGAQYARTTPTGNATLLAARPTRGVFDVEGRRNLPITVGYGSLTMRQHDRRPAETRLFGLYYRDPRPEDGVVMVDNRPLADRQADDESIRIGTIGAHHVELLGGRDGRTDLLLWGAYQFGDWGSLTHRAWSATAEVGYQPTAMQQLRPWIRVGYTRSSGDGDPVDDRHGTFFQLLPTPRLHARFPFHNLMNVREVSGSLILRPGDRLTLRGDLRRIRLDSEQDLWYAGGGAFEAGSFGYAGRPSGGETELATLTDLSASLRLTQRLTVSGYLARASGAAVVETIYPDGATATLRFLEIEFRR
jgi:hypothetical protein